jgi:hypothetical protein
MDDSARNGESMSDTLTLPDAKTDDGTGTDDGEVFHYVRRGQIVESVVDGRHAVALCGEVFLVTKTPPAGAKVCAECKRIYEKLRK